MRLWEAIVTDGKVAGVQGSMCGGWRVGGSFYIALLMENKTARVWSLLRNNLPALLFSLRQSNPTDRKVGWVAKVWIRQILAYH